MQKIAFSVCGFPLTRPILHVLKAIFCVLPEESGVEHMEPKCTGKRGVVFWKKKGPKRKKGSIKRDSFGVMVLPYFPDITKFNS